MPEQVERDYTMEDLDMLVRAQVFHNAFVIDKADFVANFPHLDDPFAADFQTAIDAADALPSAQEVDGEIVEATFNLNEQLPIARKALQKLYTYLDIVWPKGQKNSRFGRINYEKVRQSHSGLKELLEQGHRQAEEPTQKAALIAGGYTQASIDELETIMNAIDTLLAVQVDLMGARFEKTRDRILALNHVWSFMQQINKASKVTFVDNSAKLELYLLYPTKYTSLGKVQNLSVVLDGGPPLKAIMNWDFVTGGIDYEVERSAVPLGLPEGAFVPIITVQDNNYTDLIGGGQTYYYRVRAKNLTLTGAYSDVFRLDT